MLPSLPSRAITRGVEIAWLGSFGGGRNPSTARVIHSATQVEVPRFRGAQKPILGKSIFFASRHLYVTRYHRMVTPLKLYTEIEAVCAQCKICKTKRARHESLHL